MKQVVIISGKGGTGKTVLTGSFAALAKDIVIADCDVDAADLHLLLQPKIKKKYEFHSGYLPTINSSLCVQCGKCRELCRFDAISKYYKINKVNCEGCAFCSYICPEKAITMEENNAGEWYISETRFGPLVHAKLGIAEESSGKLVSCVRKKAKEIAEAKRAYFILIDGTPGIGCPVIASLSGVDLAIVITEPSISGLHDAQRVIKVANHFNVPVKMVINKYDLNPVVSQKIEEYAQENNIQLLGKVSFDKKVVKSVVNGETVIEYGESKAKNEIITIWNLLQSELL